MNKVYYFMIVVLLIGVLVYAQVNRYRVYLPSDDDRPLVLFYVLDTWRGSTFIRVAGDKERWIDLGKPKAGEKL